jgi:hypothetical protein
MCFPSIAIQVPQMGLLAIASCNRTKQKDRQKHRQIIANQVTIVHKYACKLAVYVHYLIGNNIGTND